ncbi:MAG TPA: DUF1566 domain-containing protein [Terriglobales bacterium]|nr:DUF1566 domain-containing protein [Terriglobales bacterium]
MAVRIIASVAVAWATAAIAADPPAADNTPRYQDNGDGTITDTKTKLIWEKLSDDESVHDKDKKYTWTDCIAKIKALNAAAFAGQNDWRLPNVDELATLATRGKRPPTDPIFNFNCTPKCSVLMCSCSMAGHYWSSTTYKIDPAIAGAVDFRSGFVDSVLRTNNNFVRAVRGGS